MRCFLSLVCVAAASAASAARAPQRVLRAGAADEVEASAGLTCTAFPKIDGSVTTTVLGTSTTLQVEGAWNDLTQGGGDVGVR
jgi:hypothetical protein